MREPIKGPTGFGRFGDAIAALGGDISLKPGETTSVVYLLVIAPQEDEVLRLIDKYSSTPDADAAVRASDERLRQRLDQTSVKTEQPDFDC